jgi:hypothetical protein
MTLKASERDSLLIRLEERTCNIWHVLEKIEKHQEAQNGFIQEALVQGAKNNTRIKIISGVGGTILLTLFGWLVRISLF